MYDKPRILLAGDTAIVVEYGDEISEECNSMVLNIYNFLKRCNVDGVVSMIPTYRSLLIKYNPLKIGFEELVECVKKADMEESGSLFKPRVIEIPVAYGGEFGPDLDFVAEYHNMTPEEIIEIHMEPLYRIYMLGFTMGFAYLGGMSEKIATPRLETPREKIEAGSVGIAGGQTGIYPLDSPGGWRLIGRTPVKLYDPRRENPILLEAGNYIKFVRISPEEYHKIGEEVERGTYNIKTYEYETYAGKNS
ncbi:5-oxoprolinase subunit PxpB [Thermosediminibacter oceani]|uniref:Allophanate hydrolase subunit 1 n=1 Tax=Thermosediminibacter oceani (strain ATCC BAA-1034 / DSM 16646 / JW/IW-1228P) TaxID=555079 RepID=D9RZ17_THEOJ|nr:5-oxoprolinase subunit PxpB [Thermosediminibacter oceani]ADL08571.1 Allophanate hydrolase subunit 1 [Thermosediminibacter oceani DSM 16646]